MVEISHGRLVTVDLGGVRRLGAEEDARHLALKLLDLAGISQVRKLDLTKLVYLSPWLFVRWRLGDERSGGAPDHSKSISVGVFGGESRMHSRFKGKRIARENMGHFCYADHSPKSASCIVVMQVKRMAHRIHKLSGRVEREPRRTVLKQSWKCCTLFMKRCEAM